ncbi:protein kinase C-binding protein NELL2-like isoform X2 [Dreissena polymorpha]|uniref:VWFC domain-containing protein n=1 Tax=Dreissena polymorpha TaxID=45954 RepID=A0A9D4IE65_DREPO|nr:protein kinase C-binding protein NELL2-like isoform X2 [Dreissena polymorpha]KAH3770179.1 hypothetical protein DPMN_171462 [Dreissena polymorpha]
MCRFIGSPIPVIPSYKPNIIGQSKVEPPKPNELYHGSVTLNVISLTVPGRVTATTAQTGVTGGNAEFCIYKGQIYQQGQHWIDGCQYNCTCEDAKTGFYRCNDMCPVWNNLPNTCTLQKAAGECCSQPVCQNGQVLNQTNTCFYGGNFYREGEQWQDGCKYNCQCMDGRQGYYECQKLCLTWNLPPSCHLDPPPSGKCCQVPVCPANIQLQYPPGFVQH